MKDITLGEVWQGFKEWYKDASVVFTTAIIVGWCVSRFFV
jgi:hypothetical protein